MLLNFLAKIKPSVFIYVAGRTVHSEHCWYLGICHKFHTRIFTKSLFGTWLVPASPPLRLGHLPRSLRAPRLLTLLLRSVCPCCRFLEAFQIDSHIVRTAFQPPSGTCVYVFFLVWLVGNERASACRPLASVSVPVGRTSRKVITCFFSTSSWRSTDGVPASLT